MANYSITPGERTWTYKASVIATNTGCSLAEARTLKLGNSFETTNEDIRLAFEAGNALATVTEVIPEP